MCIRDSLVGGIILAKAAAVQLDLGVFNRLGQLHGLLIAHGHYLIGLSLIHIYYHLKRMNSSDKYKAVKAEITAIYHENKGRYGYRRITAELHKRNFLLNHKTVQRLMNCLLYTSQHGRCAGIGARNEKPWRNGSF